MDLRPAGIHRLAHVEERRPLLVLDLDQTDRLARGVLVHCGDSCDRLTLVADFVDGEQWLVRRDSERLQVAVDVVRNVLVGDHRMHAGQRFGLARVEASDCGVVVGRAQRLRPERAADADVVDVLCLARDVRDAVVTRESRADGLHAGLPGISTSASSGSKLGSTRSGWTSPLAAASTALTILMYPVQRQT